MWRHSSVRTAWLSDLNQVAGSAPTIPLQTSHCSCVKSAGGSNFGLGIAIIAAAAASADCRGMTTSVHWERTSCRRIDAMESPRQYPEILRQRAGPIGILVAPAPELL